VRGYLEQLTDGAVYYQTVKTATISNLAPDGSS
jgi:hypothetical protein